MTLLPDSDKDWGNVAQALLWVHRRCAFLAADDFDALRIELPSTAEPYNELVLALRRGEIDHKGDLVIMVEDIDLEAHPSPGLIPIPPPECDADYLEIRKAVLGPYPALWQGAELDREVRVNREEWRVAAIDWKRSYLDLCGWPPGTPRVRTGLTPWADQWLRLKNIELSTHDLRKRFAPGAATMQLPPDGSRPICSTAANAGGRRGRPARWDWNAIREAAQRELESASPPRSQSKLCDRGAEWCCAQYGEAPAASTLHERLGPIWHDWCSQLAASA